jgi:hypothetical protein
VVDAPREGAHPLRQGALDVVASAATSARAQARAISASVSAETPRKQVVELKPAEPLPKGKADAERWKQFEELGLRPKPATVAAQKFVVTTYRLIGFAILTFVVVVLLGYIVVTTFYFLNRTWVAPIAISSNDEHVIALQSQLAAQLNERERLAGDLEQAERAIVAEQSFHLQFVKAIQKDLQGRKLALGRAQQLSHAAAATRREIRTTNGDYSASTFTRMNEDYEAGMIDRMAMLAGKFQLAQISTANPGRKPALV